MELLGHILLVALHSTPDSLQHSEYQGVEQNNGHLNQESAF